jgi:hypothetical protein
MKGPYFAKVTRFVLLDIIPTDLMENRESSFIHSRFRIWARKKT